MRPNLKFILSIASGVLCAVIVGVGLFVFWQKDHGYWTRIAAENQTNNAGYVTIDSHHFGPLIDQYKNPYMGDADNMRGLFDNLLLVRAGVSIGIDADTYTVQVYYQTSEEKLGSANVRVALLYNSVAAFTLIDNLQNIDYHFLGNNFAYTINRSDVEACFGTDNLAAHFSTEYLWETNFQNVMKEDSSYREDLFHVLFVVKGFPNSDFDANTTAAVGRDVG